MCRPERALLAPQPAPDCGFGRPQLQDPGPRGPDQWTRLKLEYERKCYQNAEKIVRERLRLLQAATRCEAEPRSTITAQQNADRACGSRIRQVIFLPYWINIVHRR